MSSSRQSSSRRTRILFIDDQKDVAETLSGLLAKENLECQFAEDGEAGLMRLSAEVFDLAVVDLRMPPGRWGGLWLLRELKEHGRLVHTIVLSGDAGQPETIDAMRLGARDFVVKHNAPSELADRVGTALATAAEERADWAANQLPTPIALPYQRMAGAKDRQARLRTSLIAAEAIIRFCALTGIAIVRAQGALDRAILDRLARPSLGTWLETCKRLGPLVGGHSTSRWIQAVCAKGADAVVRHRNDLVHGDGMPAVGIERALADVLSWLDFFVLAARSGSSIELVVAGSMESSGTGSFRVDMARLAGAARSVAWTRTDWQASLATGHVYLRSQAEDLDLWPLVLAEPGDFDGNWKVSVMEGIDQAHRDRVADHDCLRYINTATGKRSLSTERVLGDLMSRYQERPA